MFALLLPGLYDGRSHGLLLLRLVEGGRREMLAPSAMPIVFDGGN